MNKKEIEQALCMSKKEVHDAIFNYHWMMRLLINKKEEMTGSSNPFVAKYGTDASLPSTNNNVSDPVYQEFLRIERYEKNTEKIKKKIMMIQKHSRSITNLKEQLILDKLLNGKSMREIASELDMSLGAVNRKKDVIVNKIYQSIQMEQTKQTEQKREVCI